MAKSKKSSKMITMILMMISLNTIYLLPYLMYYYYTPLQEAMGLVGQDAAYGRLVNVYGIANLILYLPGGWIADKYDSKKLMVFSMIATGVLGLWEATWPSYTILVLIHVLFAITTVLTYWSSSIKCINLISDPDEQGSTFSGLEAGRSLCGLLLTTVFLMVYTAFAADSSKAMSIVVVVVSVVMILVGIGIAFLMPKTSGEGTTNATLIDSIKAMGIAFKTPVTYLLAGMIFAASMTNGGSSYFAPYLQNVFGLSGTVAVYFANYSKTICTIVGAVLAAILAKKMGRSSRLMIYAGVIDIILYAVMFFIPASAPYVYPMLFLMIGATLCFPIFRALYYAVIDEVGTPKHVVGSVIGIASLLGFLPDTFYTSLVGAQLEADPVGGYKFVFITGILAMVLGTVCALISDRMITKYRKTDEYRAVMEAAEKNK